MAPTAAIVNNITIKRLDDAWDIFGILRFIA